MAARSAGWRRHLLAALYPLTLATLLVSLAGWESCYVFVQDRSSEQVAALFGGQLVGPLLSAREADTPKAAWPSVGPAGRRWTMVIDPHLEFGDSDDVFARARLGPGSCVLRLSSASGSATPNVRDA